MSTEATALSIESLAVELVALREANEQLRGEVSQLQALPVARRLNLTDVEGGLPENVSGDAQFDPTRTTDPQEHVAGNSAVRPQFRTAFVTPPGPTLPNPVARQDGRPMVLPPPPTVLTPDAIAFQIQELYKMVSRVPGTTAPFPLEVPGNFSDSPFVEAISSIDIPDRVQPPIMTLFAGTSDPQEHIAHYKQRMFTVSIPPGVREACMCKCFGSTLTGPALDWFVNLPNASISNFAGLVNLFYTQYASSRRYRKRASDLYGVVQRQDETIKSYMDRFNTEKVTISDCDMPTAIEAFRKGLLRGTGLYEDLTKRPCSTYEEAQYIAIQYVRLEEDAQIIAG